jgi:hypothetical protein
LIDRHGRERPVIANRHRPRRDPKAVSRNGTTDIDGLEAGFARSLMISRRIISGAGSAESGTPNQPLTMCPQQAS